MKKAAQLMKEQDMTHERLVEMEIFKSGVHTDSMGRTKVWQDSELDEIAASYDPSLHEAPAVLGHPAHDDPALGWVESLIRRGGALVARLRPSLALRQLVKDGLFKKRSAAFYHPSDLHNPTPGLWYLRHIGFLGAQPPAIKSLPDTAFHEEDKKMFFEFIQPINQGLTSVPPHANAMLNNIQLDPSINHQRQKSSIYKKEASMNFKERVKSFLGKAVDAYPETTDIDDANNIENRISEAIRETRERVISEFMEKERIKLRRRQRENRRRVVTEFCESRIKEGKLIPAWEKAGLSKFLEQLPDSEDSLIQFSENEPAKSPFDWMISFLERLPQTVPLEELAGRKEQQQIPLQNSGSLQLVQLARKRCKKENITFSDALRMTVESHPELYEEYALEG